MICLEVSSQTQMHFKAEGDAVFGGSQTCPGQDFPGYSLYNSSTTNPQPGQELQSATRAQMNTQRKDFTTSLILQQQKLQEPGPSSEKTSQFSQVHDHIHTRSPQ